MDLGGAIQNERKDRARVEFRPQYRELPLLRCPKAGSQSDTRPYVALIRTMHKFITKKSWRFLDHQTQKRNTEERKDRI